MKTEALYLVEAVGFDKALGTSRTLRFANRAFTTKPSESPANTPYEVCLDQAATIGRSLFGSARTRGRSQISLGDVVLLNPDGALDYLNELAFDTRTLTVLRSTVLNPSYPADFDSLVLTMEQPVCDNRTVTFKVRDRFYEVVTTPLQTNKYLGTNVAPNGLEGTAADLKGKPKPVCLGVVKNVPAPCVNTSKLIYQVNDGPVESVNVVYDRGVGLIPGRKWTTNGIVHAANIIRIEWGNGIFVAIFGDRTLYTSPDGVTWTFKQTIVEDASGVAFGNGRWVIVCPFGDSVTSTDNFATITNHADVIPRLARDVCYHEIAGLFVAAGDGTMTSPDGVTWTSSYSGTTIGLNSCAYGNGVVVAVGSSGSTNGLMVSSQDAVVWNDAARNYLTSTDTFLDVVYGRDRFVAVAKYGSAVSLDGFTWQIVQQPFLGAGFAAHSLAYSGVFVINPPLGYAPRTSLDGLTWYESPTIFGAVNPGIIAANDSFVMTAIGGLGADRGSAFYTQVASYASEADLLDDTQAPMPGAYTMYGPGGCFRIGSPPDGIITADVTEGATAADRTAAAIANRVLGRIASAPSFDAGDLTALDGDDNSELGYWTMNEGVTCDQVLDAIAGTPNAAWYPDKSAAFRIARFEAPAGTPDLVITKDDIKRDSLKRLQSNDDGNGIPIYQVVVQWGRFYQTITSDIAGIVTDAARAEFAQEWRNAVATDLSVLTAHPSAGVLVIQSLYTTEADALAEANRQLALRKVKRDVYEFTIQLNDETAALDLNGVVEIVHPRYSLSVVGSVSESLTGIGTTGGGLFRILDVRPNAEAKELTLTVWGGARYKNLIAADGAYIIAADGAFIISEIAA